MTNVIQTLQRNAIRTDNILEVSDRGDCVYVQLVPVHRKAGEVEIRVQETLSFKEY